MRRAAALLAVLAFAAPAVAEDRAMLESQLSGLKKPEEQKVLRAASAACLLGLGDVEAIAAPFVAAGWERMDDAEMGMTSLTPPAGEAYVSLYDDGRICDVASEVWGSDTALGAVQILSGIAGLSLDSIDRADGCISMALTPAASVTVTSSGNDPVCWSETTSTLRFEATGQ
jgi:hypothetical protein